MERVTYLDSTWVDYPVGRDMKLAIDYVSKASLVIRCMKAYEETNHVVIFCQGSSGAILATLLAARLDYEGKVVHINHIKKDGEHSHYDGLIPWSETAFTIIIDNFASSGGTINNIYEKITEYDKDFHLNVLVCGGASDIPNLYMDDERPVATDVYDYTINPDYIITFKR